MRANGNFVGFRTELARSVQFRENGLHGRHLVLNNFAVDVDIKRFESLRDTRAHVENPVAAIFAFDKDNSLIAASQMFVKTIVEQQGYIWIGYGAIITIVPLLIAGLIGRYCFKLNYYTLIGVLSGATTNPPALAFSNDSTSCDAPSVGYATVYPLSMFLRVLTAQLLILSLAKGLV